MQQNEPGLDVLNIGAGHLKFRFNKDDAEDTEKAKRVITDMLKRGYMLFVLVDGEQKRVRQFDPEKEEYILEEPEIIPEPQSPPSASSEPRMRTTRSEPKRRVSLRKARATGVGPTAGG